MADSEGPLAFIQAAKTHGASDEFLVNLLRHQGWPERKIFGVFREHYQALTGLSIPQRYGSGEGAKEAFYYLVGFLTLGTWTIALGSLFFNLIEAWIPDPLERVTVFTLNSIADYIAAIIVGFPIYLFVTRYIQRGLLANPAGYESPVRKWLTYLAMLIAVGIVVADGVTFLSFFLRGDLTTRFVLKVLVVLVIAGGVLFYYLSSLQRPSDEVSHAA